MASISVFIATLLVLAGKLVTQLSPAGQVYVTYNSKSSFSSNLRSGSWRARAHRGH